MTRSPIFRSSPHLLLAGVLLAVTACGGGGGGRVAGPSTDGTQQPTPGATPSGFDFGPNNPIRVTAFGDSITRGVLGEVDGASVSTSNNYPNNLQLGLRTLNPQFRVINRGMAGEVTTDGRRRIRGVMALDKPGFILIMEGTNDATEDDDPAFIVANLESMVTQAQGNHTIPVIGTIPPNFRNDPTAQTIVRVANQMIRTMATTRKVVLAEIFDGMNDRSLFASPERGIPDPLHPNERGYVRMAGIWFTAMQQAIPAPPPPPTAPAPPAPAPGGTPPAEVGQRPVRRG
jgi:lysophospholipase L1-like esterase